MILRQGAKTRLAAVIATAAVACGGVSAAPTEQPTCTSSGFQLSVGQPLTLRFDAPAHVYVLGGVARIDGNDSKAVRVEVQSSDDTTPRVVGAHGEALAAEVRACRGAENVWPVAVEVTP